MADFPGTVSVSTTILSTFDQSRHAPLTPYAYPTSGGVWPAANRALYVPVIVEKTVTVTQMAFLPTVQSGNFDIGIYTETGTRLVSAGSTVMGVAATVQAVNITDTVLTPGVYYLALCVDNTTAAVQRAGAGSAAYLPLCGVQQQAVGAVTLPNPATFANPAAAYVPLVQALCMSATI